MTIDPTVWEVLSRIAKYHDHNQYRRIFVCGSFYSINSSINPIHERKPDPHSDGAYGSWFVGDT